MIPGIIEKLTAFDHAQIAKIQSLNVQQVLEHPFLHAKSDTIDELADRVVRVFVATSFHTKFGRVLDEIVTETARYRSDWVVWRPEKGVETKLRYKGIDTIIQQGSCWMILSCKLSHDTLNGSSKGGHLEELHTAARQAHKDGATTTIPILAFLGQDPPQTPKMGVQWFYQPKNHKHYVIHGRMLFHFLTGNPLFWEQLHQLMRERPEIHQVENEIRSKIAELRHGMQEIGFSTRKGVLDWGRLLRHDPMDLGNYEEQLSNVERTVGATPPLKTTFEMPDIEDDVDVGAFFDALRRI